MINKKLDKAERDANEMEELDQQWRDGEITDKAEYQRRKAGLMKISINELTTVARSMHKQIITPPGPDNPQLPPGTQPLALGHGGNMTPAHLEAMLKAASDGNIIEITRLRFGGQGVQRDIPLTI